ncbi:MAG TPA: efflux RND transporter permease subunit [Candidatus Binatia bacterium]|nr:efflux RND transporter permease subunit [Candidatus Binatia bacterium]
MQKLAEICIRRPVFAAMLILALVVVGAAAYSDLGVDRFPAVDVPQVRVRASLPGAAPEEMETEVAQPLEQVINTVEGLDELRSISGSGASVVVATFLLERDIDVAAQDVRDRVTGAMGELPREMDLPSVAKFDNESSPVLSVAVSGQRPLRELTDLADRVVKVQLERSPGVGEIRMVGGLERAINIWVDADRLAAMQLPITTVRDAILTQNSRVPGGNVTTATVERSLRTLGRLSDAESFNELVLATREGTPIRIRDIGWAEDGTKEQRSVARLDDVPTVTLELRRQSGANSVAVIEGVKKTIAELGNQLPSDVSLEILRDQSRYIHAAQHEITVHLVLGSILACLVVLAFMRSWRSTLIAGVAIPASVIATFACMWALDFTLNSVTMLALVLMVGVVIDDAIVVLENIFRFVEEKKLPAMEAARQATNEIGLAVLATTLSLVVVFVPVSFMSSISGRFLYQFGITAAAAILVSLLVSFTLTPAMSARLLEGDAKRHGATASRSGFYARLDSLYARGLGASLRRRKLVGVLAVLVMLSVVPLYGVIQQEYIPTDVDEAEFEVNVTAPEGTSVAAMDEAMRKIAADISSTRGVTSVLTTVGGGFLGIVNQGGAYVRIAPHEQRYFSISRFFASLLRLQPWQAFMGNYTQRDVMQALRAKLKAYPDLRASVRNTSSFSLGTSSADIDFNLRGPDLQTLATKSEELRSRMLEMGGIADADTTLKLAKPELRVVIDRDRAADLGVQVEDIALAMRLMVGGDDRVSRFVDPTVNEDYDVQVRLEEGDRNDPSTILRLFVPRADGGLARLDSVASLDPAATASRIDRLDRQRVASIRATVAPGFALGDRLDAVRKEAANIGLPAEYSTGVSGKGRELERTFTQFLWAFLLSIVFMYMILAAQYESLLDPVTILLSLPLSVPFALLSMWLAGSTLNLFSALGILVLFGVVKKNSILQVDHIKQLRSQGVERTEAILRGSRDRLRPILMTTLTLVAGMMPLALGTGPGAEERYTIAVVVIGGQSLSLALTLIVTPVAYAIFDDMREALVARKRGQAPFPAVEKGA